MPLNERIPNVRLSHPVTSMEISGIQRSIQFSHLHWNRRALRRIRLSAYSLYERAKSRYRTDREISLVADDVAVEPDNITNAVYPHAWRTPDPKSQHAGVRKWIERS